jgi:hypothetical protein
MKLVFLLEEPSMQAALEGILPRLIPGVWFQCVPHEGKQDLEKSVPRKLRGWREPGVRFIVVRDQDSADCHDVKNILVALCQEAKRPDTLVRVACRELEAWFLGDLQAVERGLGIENLACRQGKTRYREPDHNGNPFQELRRLVPTYQKVSGARRIGSHLTLDHPRSHSFAIFLQGIRRIVDTRNLDENPT